MDRHRGQRREHIDGKKSWRCCVQYENKRWKQYKIEKAETWLNDFNCNYVIIEAFTSQFV